jgi:hypothetical protein
MKKQLVLMAIISIALPLYAHTNYTGYSGAPGSQGTCAYSCHGTAHGTIQIDGFPAEYVPQQTYTITISHAGGNPIIQYNGSCRVGTGSLNAGVISAGTNTETYNVPAETNGIHFSSPNLDSATFSWTAPHQGVGEVRLYIAGQQGSESGPNSTLVIVAAELQSTVEGTTIPSPTQFALLPAYPNPFNASTEISYELPYVGKMSLVICDILGNQVATLFDGIQPSGRYQMTWNAGGFSSGIYFCRLSTPGFQSIQKMVLIK